jgi:hypothetical protein
MSLAVQKIPVSPTSRPAQADFEEQDRRLNISVVFTSVESTLASLKEAGLLARKLRRAGHEVIFKETE